MIQFPEEFDSVFRYVEVVSQRAQQIITGAKPRAESQASKPTLQARDDVDAGCVQWRVLTQEELDAQRQAMVEQFRAEMSAEEKTPEAAEAVLDVLPTTAPPAPVTDGDEVERDDELARLQQLLGLVGGKPTEPDGEPEAEDEGAKAEPLDLAEGAEKKVDEES